jgi:hypothetical protein
MKTLQAVIVARILGRAISIPLSTCAHFFPNLQSEAAQPARQNRSLGSPLATAAPLVLQQITLLS